MKPDIQGCIQIQPYPFDAAELTDCRIDYSVINVSMRWNRTINL
nr:MAG TPA_asm: hypothetical protein [Caudoviricetes sp.]